MSAIFPKGFDTKLRLGAAAGLLAVGAIGAALLYLAHNQGPEFVRIALANAADKTSAASLFAAAGKTGKPMAVALGVASRVPFWIAQEPA